MPLLEGCVASAVRVAERLGVKRPWNLVDNECSVWKELDDELELGLVDRYFNGELCTREAETPFYLKVVYAFAFVYLQLTLLLTDKTLGVLELLRLKK